MRLCKSKNIDRDILALKLGWSLAGPPLMTACCYIFDRIMIDTGQSRMEKEVLSIAREQNVERIFLTHHHEDHSGNAAAIRKALQADVYGHRLTRRKLEKPYPILPYQKYVWGRTTPVCVNPFPHEIDTSSGRLVPIHTPGHAKDHTVFFLPEKGVLFSGDLYLADRIKFFRSDEDIGSQIESLKTVADLDFDDLLCGHFPRLGNGRHHIRKKLDFLENFYGNIIALSQKGLSEKQIFHKLKLKEAYLIKYFCFGNVSMLNGVRSTLRHYESQVQ
jgi:glyoxylase-like metal-dependent hydrolase (beta-lactamase superfamily II)